jgi:hypothetical protein
MLILDVRGLGHASTDRLEGAAAIFPRVAGGGVL